MVWYLFIHIIWQKNAKNPRCFSLSVSIILSLPVCRTHLSAQTLTAVGKKKKITESEAARKWHFTCGFTRAVKIGFFSETSREARRRSEIFLKKNVWRCDGFLQRSELNAPACSRSGRGEEQLFLWQCYHSLYHFINTIQVAVLLIFFTDRRDRGADGGKIWGQYYRLWLLSLSARTLWDKKKKDILTEKLEMNEKYIRVILWLLFDKKTELRYGI